MTISGFDKAEYNTEFRELANGVFTNAEGTFVITPRGKTFEGCAAVNSVPNADCHPGKRWAFFGSRDTLVKGGDNVNIWSKKGVNSGTYDCKGTIYSTDNYDPKNFEPRKSFTIDFVAKFQQYRLFFSLQLLWLTRLRISQKETIEGVHCSMQKRNR